MEIPSLYISVDKANPYISEIGFLVNKLKVHFLD